MRWAAPRGVLVLVLAITATAAVLGTTATTRASGATPRSYYLSLGDSLAQGYQPGYTGGTETLHGFSNMVVADVAKRYHLTLENYGCGGATSASILYTDGCRPGGLANNGVRYPTMPQSVAAVDFIRAHRGHIGLISLSIGWNDFDSCVGMADPSACVTPTLAAMEANLKVLASHLRGAAGAATPIVAMTYSDPDLADWLLGPTGKATAMQWVNELRHEVNPSIEAAYRATKITVLHVTEAYDTYAPWSAVVKLAPYGTIPKAVAMICEHTWMCKVRNEDANSLGYALIAGLISKYLLARR
jgi:lysophospholipase L1-like esterase